MIERLGQFCLNIRTPFRVRMYNTLGEPVVDECCGKSDDDHLTSFSQPFCSSVNLLHSELQSPDALGSLYDLELLRPPSSSLISLKAQMGCPCRYM